MALQQLTGTGSWICPWQPAVAHVNNGGFTSSVIDATGEKMAWVGPVWFPARTGTKAIRRVQFRFMTVTKAGGSALTVSLQDMSASTGSPGQPDDTQDQTVAIANADASFASNTWYRTGTLSADRTVSIGDLIAVVVEFDGGGRLGADAINFAGMAADWMSGWVPVLKTGGSYARTGTHFGNMLLEFSDGTFGVLEQCLPVSAFNTHSYNSGSSPDEHALAFSLPYACKIDGLRFLITNGSNVDCDFVLYEGTSALATVSVDGNRFAHNGILWIDVPIPETSITANTTYYAAMKPTTTTSLSVYSCDVNSANHLSLYPGGTSFNYSTRTDAGSWAAVTTTRRLMAGIRISSNHDGAGGGGTCPIGLGSPVIRAA